MQPKSYKQFFETHVGKGWDPDSYGSYQCMDLWIEWFNYMFGYNPPPQGSAYMVWNNRFQIFANLIDQVSFHESDPKVGDVVVYGANIPNFTGSNGHIAIFDHAPMFLFTQNFACNNLNGNGDPLCPAEVKNHGSSRPLGFIRFNGIEENGGISVPSIPQQELSPTQGMVMGDTNVRPDPSTNGIPVETIVQDRPIDCIASVQGQEIEGKTTWIQVSNGYISITRFSQLPSQLNEVAQTPTPPVETPPAPPQVDIPTQNRLNFKALDGIRGRTTPRFEDNIYTEISGAGKSVNVLSIVDGADYEGSNQWVKYMYDDIKTDDRADIVLYSHRSFFE